MGDSARKTIERTETAGRTIERRRATVAEAAKVLPGPGGERFAKVLEHGSMEVELYAPRGVDGQTPHSRDELYVVASGSGEFVNGPDRHPFGPGDVLFVPAGVEHRFEDFTEDFAVWVVFYGPEGGESALRGEGCSNRPSRGGPFEVVKASLQHVDLAVPLFDAYRRFYGQPTDLPGAREFLERRLTRGESMLFLALAQGDRPAGFAQLYPTFSSVSMARRWILNDLFVAPEARNGGVGRALLGAARSFAEDTGARDLELKTKRDNRAAQSLYESTGWERDEAFFTYALRLRRG